MVDLAVVINNYNYGHYLADCVESVLAQTRPAAEIVIVDDGSTDGSRALIERYRRHPRVEVVLRENGGQTAAINAGFAATSADAVLFLDADDRLRPNALETVALMWTGRHAMYCWRLGLIDEDGRRIGAYHEPAAGGDNLPHLLARGSFPHYPTSANAFRRSAIAPAFPLPQDDWPISTDALLVRLGAMAGPVRLLDHELGDYRIHGGNNYYTEGLADLTTRRRALRHMEMAARYLAFQAAPVDGRPDLPHVRLELALRAVRLVFAQCDASTDFRGSAARVRAIGRSIGASAFMPPGRWRALLAIAPFALSDRLNARWSRIAQLRQVRSAALHGATGIVLGRHLLAGRRAAAMPREMPVLPGRLDSSRDQFRLLHILSARDWEYSDHHQAFVLCSACGELTLRLPASATPVTIYLNIRTMDWLAGEPIELRISEAHGLLTSRSIASAGTVGFTIPAREMLGETVRTFRLETRRREAGWRQRLARPFRPVAMIALDGIGIEEAQVDYSGLFLPVNGFAAFGTVAHALVANPNVLGLRDGKVVVARSPAAFDIWLPDSCDAAELVMRFGPAQRPSWLKVYSEGVLIRDGTALAGGTIRLPVTSSERPPRRAPVQLIVNFLDQDAAASDSFLDIEEIGLSAPVRDRLTIPHEEKRRRLWPLAMGTRLTGSSQTDFARYFISGWVREDDRIMLARLAGSIAFRRVPTEDEMAVLHLSLVPGEGYPGLEALLLVDVNGRRVVEQNLIAPVDLEIPLDGSQDGAVTIGVVSGIVGRGDDAGEPLASGLIVSGVELLPRQAADAMEPAASEETPGPGSTPLLPVAVPRRLAAPARNGLFAFLIGDVECAGRSGARLARLASMSGRAVESLAMQDDIVEALAGFCPPLGEGDDPSARGHAGAEPPASRADRLRALFAAILSGPAWQALDLRLLPGLPEILLLSPAALCRYLVDPGGTLTSRADQDAYHRHVEGLLGAVIDMARTETPGTVRFEFARTLLEHVECRQLLFGEHNLRHFASLFGDATATIAVAGGHEFLAVPDRQGIGPPGDGRLRLGVLVSSLEDTPETALLFGMYGGLDRGRFSVTVFHVAGGPRLEAARRSFDRVHAIGNLQLADVITLIRLQHLHAITNGSFTLGYSNLNAVFARRLAPFQFMTSAVSPASTGQRNCDLALSSRLWEPADAQDQYSEPLELWDEPVQCFDFGAAPLPVAPDVNPDIARRRLGLPLNRFILTSGAMADKIGDDLMACWAEILAAVPKAVFVVYPFPSNWLGGYDTDRFRRHVHRHLDARKVDHDRFIILDTLPRRKVAEIQRASDLYLDSFPYSGATTVVEALRNGLPVVSLRGKTQRGLQGTGWLRAHGLGEYVAATRQAYVGKARELLSSRRHLAAARRQTEQAVSAAAGLHDPAAFGARFGTWLEEKVAERCDWKPAPPKPLAVTPASDSIRYVFHHMPKAGGTSVMKVLGDRFQIVRDYRPPWADGDFPDKIDLGGLRENQILCGHFEVAPMRIERRYPEMLSDSRYRLLTFVRDPLERSLSDYFFQKRRRLDDPRFQYADVSSYLRDVRNAYGEHFGCDATNWEEHLGRYWFVGTVERFDECMTYLSREMGFEQPPMLPRLNVAERDEVPSRAALSAFARNNALDFTIYRHVTRRLDQLLGECDRSHSPHVPAARVDLTRAG